MTTLATVAQIWVFPVKSMSGTELEQAEVEGGGLVGDRSWAVVDETGETVTAAREPSLRGVVPHLVDGRLRLDVPGAEPGLDADAGAAALTAFLGRAVRLAHREGAGFVDVAPVHVVSRQSMAGAIHAPDCESCDIAAPRANLVLDLNVGTGSERDWVGRTLRAGTAGLQVVRLPKHCLGVYADVATAGQISRGATVTAVDSIAGPPLTV